MITAARLILVFSALCVFSACGPQRAEDSDAQRAAASVPRNGHEQVNPQIQTATFALG
jgi:hypothetical protein